MKKRILDYSNEYKRVAKHVRSQIDRLSQVLIEKDLKAFMDGHGEDMGVQIESVKFKESRAKIKFVDQKRFLDVEVVYKNEIENLLQDILLGETMKFEIFLHFPSFFYAKNKDVLEVISENLYEETRKIKEMYQEITYLVRTGEKMDEVEYEYRIRKDQTTYVDQVFHDMKDVLAFGINA